MKIHLRKHTHRRVLKKFEQGDSVLELAAVLPMMLLIVAFILLIAPYPRVIIATNQASYDCAMSAAQSLDLAQGYTQGVVVASQSFDAFDLDWENASIQVFGDWSRGGQVGCTVAYRMPLGAFPLVQVANVPDTVEHTTVVPAQYYKSEWTGD
jgi:hypothetical protein